MALLIYICAREAPFALRPSHQAWPYSATCLPSAHARADAHAGRVHQLPPMLPSCAFQVAPGRPMHGCPPRVPAADAHGWHLSPSHARVSACCQLPAAQCAQLWSYTRPARMALSSTHACASWPAWADKYVIAASLPCAAGARYSRACTICQFPLADISVCKDLITGAVSAIH